MTAANARKLFGTDGIRAVAGEFPLDATTIFACGLALGHSLRKTARGTARDSGPRHTRVEPLDRGHAGRGVARDWGTRRERGRCAHAGRGLSGSRAWLQAGVVISASHNPWQDNGIKLFGGDGFKLADAVELAMEDEILHHAAQTAVAPDPATLPPVEDNPAFQADYIQFLIDCVPGSRWTGCALWPIAPTERRLPLRRSCFGGWAERSHAAEHCSRRPQHQFELRRAASGLCGGGS